MIGLAAHESNQARLVSRGQAQSNWPVGLRRLVVKSDYTPSKQSVKLMLLTVDASTFRPMKTERKQISLPPECRCEQIEEREREHWLDAIAHGNTPENKPKERINNGNKQPSSPRLGK